MDNNIVFKCSKNSYIIRKEFWKKKANNPMVVKQTQVQAK